MDTTLTRRRKIRLGQLAVLIAAVSALEYLARSGLVDAITLAPPSEMFTAMVSLLVSGSILGDLVATTLSVFAAFLLATAVGIPIGWALWRWNALQQVLDPYLIAFYAMPVFALYPLFIAIFGLNRIPIVLIAFFMSIVAIVVNTANGFAKIRDVYHDVGRSLRLSRTQAFVHIYLPAAAPYIFTGLKLGFVYALIGVIASEFILANRGLGFQVAYDYKNFAMGQMYGDMLLVVIIAVCTGVVLTYVEDRLYRRSVSE